MPFSSKVKEEAFLKCGRHCCICDKFCGTKIEAHHITPEAQGGDNTIENCIPLCFDCHADMGVYNIKHPKGNNYSPTELKKHKDKAFIKYSKTVPKNIKKTSSVIISDKSNLLNIHQAQEEMINNSSLLPWASTIQSASFGFLLPDLYIQPSIHTHKYPSSSTFELSSFIENKGTGKNIILIGIPGSGKTTTLRALFFKFMVKSDQENILTLYFTAKEIIAHAPKKAYTLISLLRATYSISIRTDDFSMYNSIVIFIDGVDEINIINLNVLFKFLLNLKKNNINFWISVRSDIYNRHILNSPSYYSLFYEVCELVDWTSEQGKALIQCYSKKTGNIFIIDNVNTLLMKNNKISSFLENPFKLSLLIFILSDKTYDLSRIDANDYTLYKEFYLQWLNQENNRGTSCNDYNYIHDSHIKIALALYRERSSIYLQSIFYNEENINRVINDSAIVGLLLYSTTLMGTIVEKFQHETLAEFLVAESIIRCFHDNMELSERLSVIYNYEVNQFVRSAFETMSLTERDLILNNLSKKYNELLVDETVATEQIREQIIYYVGRIPLDSPPVILKNAYDNEKNSIAKRAAAISLILLGDEVVEADFIETLVIDDKLDLLNRSIQLIYFGDAQGDFHTYKDDEFISWENSKRTILKRLSSNSVRDVRLRLWDIVTLKSFIKSRGSSSLTDTEKDIIVKTTIDDSTIHGLRNKIFIREKDNLLTLLSEKMACCNE